MKILHKNMLFSVENIFFVSLRVVTHFYVVSRREHTFLVDKWYFWFIFSSIVASKSLSCRLLCRSICRLDVADIYSRQ